MVVNHLADTTQSLVDTAAIPVKNHLIDISLIFCAYKMVWDYSFKPILVTSFSLTRQSYFNNMTIIMQRKVVKEITLTY
jgi:hypothetical protein